MKIKNNIYNFSLYWLPPIIWGLVIFSFSSVTTPKVAEVHWQDFVVKKSAHLVEYGIFSMLLFRAFKGSGVSSAKSFKFALLIAVCYGFTDEFHQSYTPGREPRLRDALIDAVGSITVLLTIKEAIPKFNGKIKILAAKLGITY